MASSTARLSLRLAAALLLLLAAFYIGRPLYWKLAATIHEIRQNRQSVKQGTTLFPISLFSSLPCHPRFRWLRLSIWINFLRIIRFFFFCLVQGSLSSSLGRRSRWGGCMMSPTPESMMTGRIPELPVEGSSGTDRILHCLALLRRVHVESRLIHSSGLSPS